MGLLGIPRRLKDVWKYYSLLQVVMIELNRVPASCWLEGQGCLLSPTDSLTCIAPNATLVTLFAQLTGSARASSAFAAF